MILHTSIDFRHPKTKKIKGLIRKISTLFSSTETALDKVMVTLITHSPETHGSFPIIYVT